MIIDGARGEASVSHAATLDDWDARYWASQKPTLLTVAAASCSQPMPPEHLRLPGLVEIEVRPFVQGEACIALLSVASRHEAFNELDNKFIHLFGNQLAGRLHDMLMRQRSTRLLEASETRYRSLAENSADWIWVMNLDGQLIYSNERCRNVTGLSPAEICQTPLDALYHPDDRNMVRDIIRQAQNSRQGWNNLLHRCQRTDGTTATWNRMPPRSLMMPAS